MSTIQPTQPLSQLSNTRTRTCQQLGMCQNPYYQCDSECDMPRLAKLRRPTPLPNLAPGALDGPYNRSHHAHALRERRRVALALLGVVAVGVAFWMVVAYVVL